MDKLLTKAYWFRNDPNSLFLEVNRSNTINDVINSWHIIDSKGLFDDYVSSLDIRGVRQHDLYEEMMGPSGSSSLRRFLRDANYKEAMIATRQREIEEFERRLENAKVKCDVEELGGRRSGRLAPNAKTELEKIMEEMDQAAKVHEERMNEREPDYHALTAIELLNKYETEAKGSFRCAHLWLDRSSGVADVIASGILSLESVCNDLIPWDRSDVSRAEWRNKLLNAVSTWNEALTFHLGPRKLSASDAQEGINVDSSEIKESPSRRNASMAAPISFANLLQFLKVCFPYTIRQSLVILTGLSLLDLTRTI
jgi:hypothetical protein